MSNLIEVKEVTQVVKRTIVDKDAPFSNTTVWVFSWLCWPLAGWLLVYLNFKKLWYKDYALYTLIGTILGTIIVAYVLIFKIPETSSLKIWFLWPIIFVLLQTNFVDKWAKENLDKKFWSDLKALWLSLIWLVLFFGAFGIVGLVSELIFPS